MTPDKVRIDRVAQSMRERGYDALLCHLPHHVAMLSGYAPVFGPSVLVFLADGDGTLLVPESESPVARDGWFCDIRTYRAATSEYVISPVDALDPLLALVCCEKGISNGIVGVELGSESAASVNGFWNFIGPDSYTRWSEMLPEARFRNASGLLSDAAVVKSPREIERITVTGKIAQYGFDAVHEVIRPGIREVEVAAAAEYSILAKGTGIADVFCVRGFAFCTSGERTASQYTERLGSTNRHLEEGDSVLVKIICQANGLWTNLARTFFVGKPTVERAAVYQAVHEAWQAAFTDVHDGVRAADVYSTVRSVLERHGFGDALPSVIGRGAGFLPLGHDERPIIYRQSDDILTMDQVFSLEPGVYLPERWGISIRDVISVRGPKAHSLSDIPRELEWAICGV